MESSKTKRLLRFRRYFRFSLRTFLIAVTVLASLLGLHIRDTRTQKAAVEGIRDHGGWVRYDFQYPSGSYADSDFDAKAESPIPNWLVEKFGIDFFHSVVHVSMVYTNDRGPRKDNSNYSGGAMAFVGQLPKLRILLLKWTQASDESLKHLRSLTSLEYFYVWDAQNVGDASITYLAGNKGLRYIHIDTSKITDDSMKLFAAFPQLEGLSLQGGRFSNKALEYISGSEQLTKLSIGLGDITVDDNGIQHVVRLRNLEELDLQGSLLTDAGVEKLSALTQLKALYVGGVDPKQTQAITDRSVDALSKLKLERLGINKSRITDDGVRKLEAMPRLTTLQLHSAEVTLDTMTSGAGVRPPRFRSIPGKRIWYVRHNR